MINPVIFRDYDIRRNTYKDISLRVDYKISLYFSRIVMLETSRTINV